MRPLLLLAAVAAAVVVVSAGAGQDVSVFDVTWLAPTAGQSGVVDGMPVGNGVTAALVWGNATSGGLDFYVMSPLAMATDTTLLPIALVSLLASPNPCTSGAYWNQTHHLADGSVTLLCGGSGLADYALAWRVYVDANNNVIMASVAARDQATRLALGVSVTNLRPTPSSWRADMHCSELGNATADVVLPADALPANTIGLYHVNDLAAGDAAFFTSVMRQQGLESLLPQFSDPLDGRIWGMAVAGAAGDGSGSLLRTGNLTLASAAPASAFLVRLDLRVDPAAGGDVPTFVSALAAQASAGPAPAERDAASSAWWQAFWARSYIAVGTGSNATQQLLAAQYARTRFVQAVQSRGHAVPIKFNGQLWAIGPGRQWGADHWWQNTRLP